MEATGVYNETLAYFLEIKHCKISIILPNIISKYFRCFEVKTLTDKTSSEAITFFRLEHNIELWKSSAPVRKVLKQLTRERDQLVQERTINKNQLHAEEDESVPNSYSSNRTQYQITILNDQESEIREVVKSNSKLNDTVNTINPFPK